MNVVISFDFPPKIGGAHHWLYEVYRRWPKEVAVLTRTYSTDEREAAAEKLFDRAQQGRLAVHRAVGRAAIDLLDFRDVLALHSQLKTLRKFRDGTPTVLHALRAFPEGFLGSLYRSLHARTSRLVTYAHGEEMLIAASSAQLTFMAARAFKSSDLVIANSENTRRLVTGLCPQAKVVCIHPGVDTSAFAVSAQQRSEFRKRWDWPDDTVIVATLARMERRKNQHAVIDSIAQLRGKGVNVAYVCAGQGEERDRLEARADELGIRPWVAFPGAIAEDEKRLLLASADIHAMPSIQLENSVEGFGIVFLEAAAAGIPSVAGNSGGQAEAVRHGETGLVVNGADKIELTDALHRLAVDPQLRIEMGIRAREWAAEHDWQRVVQRSIDAVDRIVPSASRSTVVQTDRFV